MRNRSHLAALPGRAGETRMLNDSSLQPPKTDRSGRRSRRGDHLMGCSSSALPSPGHPDLVPVTVTDGTEPLFERLQPRSEHVVTYLGDHLVLIHFVAGEPRVPLDIRVITECNRASGYRGRYVRARSPVALSPMVNAMAWCWSS